MKQQVIYYFTLYTLCLSKSLFRHTRLVFTATVGDSAYMYRPSSALLGRYMVISGWPAHPSLRCGQHFLPNWKRIATLNKMVDRVSWISCSVMVRFVQGPI